MILRLPYASAPLSLSVVFSVAALGCGSSTSAGPKTPPKDASSDHVVVPEAGQTDASADAATDAGPVPTGTLLAASDSLQLFGVTSDGLAIYADYSSTPASLNAVPLAGGTPELIVKLINGGAILVASKVVMVWPGISTLNLGSLSVWTSSGGLKTLSSVSYDGVAAVSTDGSSVVYSTNAAADAKSGDLWVAGSDGSNPKELLSSIQYQGSCAPVVGFAGSYVVASHCGAASPDGGVDAGVADAGESDAAAAVASATISNFTGSAWTQTDMVTGALDFWSADKMGTQVAVATDAGNFEVVALPNGTPTPIDSIGSTGFGAFTSDGSAVFYTTGAKALKRSPVANPSPATLIASGVGGLRALSPDLNWTIYYQTTPNTTTGESDLYLASTATAGAGVALSTAETGVLFGQDFTTDSSHALYYTDTTVLPMNGGLIGTFQSMPTSGGTATQLGLNVWNNLAATGTTVVFDDNFVAGSVAGTGTGDLKVVDVEKSAAPTLIAAAADADFNLTTTLDKLVYTFSQSQPVTMDGGPGQDLNGLYVVTLP